MPIHKIIQRIKSKYRDGEHYACDVYGGSNPFSIVHSFHFHFASCKRQKETANLLLWKVWILVCLWVVCALEIGLYQLSYWGSSAGWAESLTHRARQSTLCSREGSTNWATTEAAQLAGLNHSHTEQDRALCVLERALPTELLRQLSWLGSHTVKVQYIVYIPVERLCSHRILQGRYPTPWNHTHTHRTPWYVLDPIQYSALRKKRRKRWRKKNTKEKNKIDQ